MTQIEIANWLIQQEKQLCYVKLGLSGHDTEGLSKVEGDYLDEARAFATDVFNKFDQKA